ncbi:MAG: heat-shock protein Hsp20 [Chloroflexi bacterium HGW-Chloroflexi-3]|nr:MAG: heat-shock protein Hsp20 [Chloroflexi bacterium HGW-Chloroflexi-3]
MPTLYVRNPYRQLTRRPVGFINENNIEEPKVIFPVDIRVAEDEYLVEAFLPGVLTEELDIQIESNVVTIKGELKIEGNEDDRYLLRERPSGMFQRSIELPDDVDADKVEAELKNGVLTLRLPKSELAKPRKIKISNN